MPNEHTGHRRRMKERFLHTHFDGFEQHQILEMILYYVYPRTDTNPLAHRLLEAFGSISSVFEAPVDALVEAGLTQNAATFLVMIPDISRIYLNDRNNNHSKIIDFDRLSIRDASNHDIASDGDNIYFVDGFVCNRGNYIRFNRYFDGFSCNFAVRIERKFDRGCAFFEWSEEQVALHDFGFHD